VHTGIERRRFLALGAVAVGSATAAAWPACARPVAFAPPDRELMVPVVGGKLYVRVNGKLDAGRPPVILIHGGPGGSHAFLLRALDLADSRAVILYDQLDCGLSDHPGDPANWRVERFVDELEAIRGALDIPAWHVVGHSWGGTVALEYAARRPPSLASVVLASPLISTRSWIADADALRRRLPLDVQTVLKRCEGRAPPSKAECDKATVAFYSAFNGREPRSAAMKAYLETLHGLSFNETLYRYMWGSSEFSSTGTLRSYDGERLLPRLDGARTLLMVGQYDEARPETALMFADRLPGAELAVIPGAAHGTFGDRPDETLSVLRAWFARHDAKG